MKGDTIMKLKELKKGDFFTKFDISDPKPRQIWVKGDYDRSSNRYECYKWEDVNYTQLIPGHREVFCGFTF